MEFSIASLRKLVRSLPQTAITSSNRANSHSVPHNNYNGHSSAIVESDDSGPVHAETLLGPEASNQSFRSNTFSPAPVSTELFSLCESLSPCIICQQDQTSTGMLQHVKEHFNMQPESDNLVLDRVCTLVAEASVKFHSDPVNTISILNHALIKLALIKDKPTVQVKPYPIPVPVITNVRSKQLEPTVTTTIVEEPIEQPVESNIVEVPISSVMARKIRPPRPRYKGVKVKNLFCTECNFSCGTTLELNEHNNVHTGAKPFKCNVCHSCFNRRSTLHNHKRLHTDARPFVCKYCGESFKWKNSLKSHEHCRHLKKVNFDSDMTSLYTNGMSE